MRRVLPSVVAVFVAVSIAWAAVSYPTSVKVFTTKTTGETIAAAHVNDLQDEVVAIEQGLLNGFAHALKPSTDAGQTLGTSALRWKQALLGLGTVTVDTPALDITGTWNAVAVAFTGIKANFTDTASAAASLLLDLQVGGVSKFKVRKSGNVVTAGALKATGKIGATDAIGREDATIETQSPAGEKNIVHVIQGDSPGFAGSTREIAFMTSGFTSAGILRQQSSYSSYWVSADNATGYAALRLIATHTGGAASEIAFRAWGLKGAMMWGTQSDIDGPGDKVFDIHGTTWILQGARSQGLFRSENATTPTGATGPGIELGFSTAASEAFVQAFNRTLSTFLPLTLKGVSIAFDSGSGAAIAGTGFIRLANGVGIFARNAGNTADIGLISLDGSNVLSLGNGAADIRWEKGLIALGGGATATLGGIGGSGPTTAAQNSWMRVVDSTGAAFWVAVWK